MPDPALVTAIRSRVEHLRKEQPKRWSGHQLRAEPLGKQPLTTARAVVCDKYDDTLTSECRSCGIQVPTAQLAQHLQGHFSNMGL